MTLNPIYNCLSGQNINFSQLNSTDEELISPISNRAQPDFSISTIAPKRSWKEIAYLVGKIIFFPIIFPLQRLIMAIVYPIQSRIGCWMIGRCIEKDLSEEGIDKSRKDAAESLRYRGYIVRHVVLEKNGIRFSGLLIAKPETIQNGRWIMQATGNCDLIESGSISQAHDSSDAGFNTLLINGPGIGRSEGWASPESMGDAQEVGITFLEKIRASKIVLAGFSLGGAAIGQAVLQHQFKPNVQYTVVFQNTFARLSNIASAKVGGQWGGRLIQWLGLEMDTIAASEKLKKANIEQIIAQSGDAGPFFPTASTKLPKEKYSSDGVIPTEASLGFQLNDGSEAPHKHFIPRSHRHFITQYGSHNNCPSALYMIRCAARRYPEVGTILQDRDIAAEQAAI